MKDLDFRGGIFSGIKYRFSIVEMSLMDETNNLAKQVLFYPVISGYCKNSSDMLSFEAGLMSLKTMIVLFIVANHHGN